MIEDEAVDAAAAGSREVASVARLERLRATQDQVRKVTEVVQATLAAVRQGPMTKDPVFPAAILRRIAEVVRPRLTAASIDLDVRVEEDLPWLMGDAVQLELALLNLVTNSVDALRSGGQIAITAVRVDAGTRVEVADTGPGIPSDLLPRIFEPWVTTKPVGHGTGLGLSITREVIAAHAGSISVRSEPGRGTTFTIELPGKADAPAIREV
jgi:two-component system NtrC family sensor kinase